MEYKRGDLVVFYYKQGWKRGTFPVPVLAEVIREGPGRGTTVGLRMIAPELEHDGELRMLHTWEVDVAAHLVTPVARYQEAMAEYAKTGNTSHVRSAAIHKHSVNALDTREKIERGLM